MTARVSTLAVALLFAVASGCAEAPAPGKDEPAAATKDAAPAKEQPAPVTKEAAPVTKAPLKPDDLDPPIPNEPVHSPFGNPWDPTRPPPPVHETKGPGITSAKLVASGPAEVPSLPKPPGTPPVFYAAVVDVTVAPDSTTDVLGKSSITLAPPAGDPLPLFAACMPTLQDPTLSTGGEGTAIAAWTIEIGTQSWRCGGGNARMIRRVGPGGFKLTGPAPSGWTGPMVLLFENPAEPPKSVSLAGKTIELPAAAP